MESSMTTILHVAMAATAVTAGIGIAAIINAIRLNKEKHTRQDTRHKLPAAS
jgi:hypothetical protein